MITGPEPGLTRDSVASDIVYKGQRLRLFDTAGLRRKVRISELAEKLSASDAVRAIRFAEVVVLLIDAERKIEKQDLTIGDMVTQEGRALVIAVNKWDTIENKQLALRELKETVGHSLAQVPGVSVVTLSARAETGLDQLQTAIVKSHDVWNRRVPTNQLNRWLEEALSRHSPPAAAGRRIKIRYITQTSTRPPTFVAFCQRAEALPNSYLKYLTNSLRAGVRSAWRADPLQFAQGRKPLCQEIDAERSCFRGVTEPRSGTPSGEQVSCSGRGLEVRPASGR